MLINSVRLLKDGFLTIVKDEQGCIVAVTLTNHDHNIKTVFAEGKGFEEMKKMHRELVSCKWKGLNNE